MFVVSFTGGPIHGFILQARKSSDDSGVGSFVNRSLPVGSQAPYEVAAQ